MITRHPRFNLAAQAAVLFVAMLAAFAALRSNDYLAVDGALRALAAYYRPGWALHYPNHYLYLVDINAWSRLAQGLGVRPRSQEQFLRLAQLMNAAAAAGCVSILYCLLASIGGAGGTALALALGYGFARAFLLHATNSAEPMAGLLWSFGAAGLAVLAHRRRNNALALASGLLLALAMATYESTVLIAPALVVMLVSLPGDLTSSKLMRAAALCAGFVAGLVAVYGIAFSLTGTSTVAGAIGRFLKGTGEGRYGGVRVSDFVNLPIGLASAIAGFLPPDYAGLRWLFLHAPAPAMARATLGLLVAAAWVGGLVVWSVVRWRSLSKSDRAVLAVCATGLLFTAVPLVLWDPKYDKFWLQPLALLFAASAVTAKNLNPGRTRIPLETLAAIALAVVVIWNIRTAIHAHVSPTPYLADAERVAGMVKPDDLVIVDWHGISQLYQAFRGPLGKTVGANEVCAYGAGAAASLAEQIRATAAAGGQTFFVGVLDTPETVWDPWRCGVPYHSFDLFRRCSEVVAEFSDRGSKVVMRKLAGSNGRCMDIDLDKRRRRDDPDSRTCREVPIVVDPEVGVAQIAGCLLREGAGRT